MLPLIIILLYFGLLFVVSFFTSKKANNESFFIGNRKSPWLAVAIGMLGASVSGVSFISVPGWVQTTQMTYMQMVFGFVIGYFFIAFILLPIYYKLKIPSIYSYLNDRFGTFSYKTATVFFIISRFSISALRLFIVAKILQIVVFEHFKIPFVVTTIFILLIIWLYTFKAGIKTIVWTDVLQTFFMVATIIMTIIIICNKLNFGFFDAVEAIYNNSMSKMFEFNDWTSKQHFVKQFISGAFITIVMTGLDQDNMQKNLSCRTLKEAKKNVLTYGFFFIPANLLFLSLGVLLMIFVQKNAIDPNLIKGDDLYPYLAQNVLGSTCLILFVIGLIAAAFSSADSAITALTTSLLFDIIGIKNNNEKKIMKKRLFSQLGISICIIIFVLIFYYFNNKNIINTIYVVSSYTYGPLLGLFFYGLFTKWNLNDKFVPIIAIASPVFCYIIEFLLKKYFNYYMGYELLLINGILTFIGLIFIRKKVINN